MCSKFSLCRTQVKSKQVEFSNLATSLSLFTFLHWRRKWQPTLVFLPGESQGWRSLVGCCLWGRTESDTTEAIQQQQQQLYRTWDIFPHRNVTKQVQISVLAPQSLLSLTSEILYFCCEKQQGGNVEILINMPKINTDQEQLLINLFFNF